MPAGEGIAGEALSEPRLGSGDFAGEAPESTGRERKPQAALTVSPGDPAISLQKLGEVLVARGGLEPPTP